MRNDRGGTVSGRFSYSSPDLQQVPMQVTQRLTELYVLYLLKTIVNGEFLITHNKNLDLTHFYADQ